MAKIAINGFGRIGRLFFRSAFGRPDMEVVAVNDLGDVENLAYLLKYDTVYRAYGKSVEVKDGNLVVDGKVIRFLQIKDPATIPWGEMGIDVVIESTGAFESFEKAATHLVGGAKRVVISAPAKDADGPMGKTILMGVNDGEMGSVKVTSNGSCTTNACSPVIAVLDEGLGIEKAFLNTTHAYTATQSIVDSPVKGKDFRRGRAAAQNISPSSTGAAISVTRAIPSMAGKFDGIAVRTPSITGSLADITFVAKRDTTPEEVNEILKKGASSPRWSGLLAATDEQLVSSDIIGASVASIVDLQFTKVIGGDLVKVLAWYDNEAGYVSTLIAHVLKSAESVK
ncbi:MAG: glyceraldehyde 3-phosphate dehydrogenase NAD-binding domain-containing protein [Candidatus Colwellbacteria bacterium]|nr:glyceraldehyde 3-phosphate dehydrogenase NAD-binding domain-containing protein [Candidatus Colwellbacteria bacterium]